MSPQLPEDGFVRMRPLDQPVAARNLRAALTSSRRCATLLALGQQEPSLDQPRQHSGIARAIGKRPAFRPPKELDPVRALPKPLQQVRCQGD